jgi:uncharacterized protein (TIGR02246 family)
MKKLALALIPCLALISCAERPDQEEAGQEEAASSMEMSTEMDREALDESLGQTEAAWEQAFESGDAAALAALYTDDALYLAPYDEAVHGRAAIEAAVAENMGMMTNRQVTIERTDYGGSGDLAYGIGTYAVEMQPREAPEPISANGKYVTLTKRGADGTWKIYAHIWNTSMPEAEVAKMLSNMPAPTDSSSM